MTDTEQRVHKLLVEYLGVTEADLRPEASIVDDLEADSLDVVELALVLEEEFAIEVDDSDIERVTTVKEMVDFVDQALARKKG